MVRRLASLPLVLALAACPGADEAGSDVDPSPDPGFAECMDDVDCSPAASSCCECPSFALPADSGFGESCEDVMCEDPPSVCPQTMAVCEAGACVLTCTPIPCGLSCETGFARDEAGCLVCACQQDDGVAEECTADADCVRVPEDCCGCEAGGADTAVPGSEADTYTDGLACPPDPRCPGVDVCDPSQIPRCIGRRCTLGPGPDTDPAGEVAYCGTADDPPCPDGQVCVLNDPDAEDATAAGVGICTVP